MCVLPWNTRLQNRFSYKEIGDVMGLSLGSRTLWHIVGGKLPAHCSPGVY